MAFADYTLKTYTENSKAMFDYWISFFPTAPMFGVEWRFGDAFTPGSELTATEYTIERPVKQTVAAEKPETGMDAKANDGAVIEQVAIVEATSDEVANYENKADSAEVVETVAAEAAADAEDVGSTVAALLYSDPPAEIDDLKVLKGVGPSLEVQLHNLGVYKFEQLASFDRAQLEWLDDNLNTVKGSCIRDDWSGQAKALLS